MGGPLKIFHVAGSALWAGGEQFLLQMAEHMDPRSFKLAMALPEKGPLEEELRRRNIPFEVVPLSPVGSPRPFRALRRLIRDWKPDVVQSHGARSHFYARLAAGRTPTISTIHNAISDYPIPLPRKWAYSAVDRLTARRAAAVVCVAECLREDFLRRCPSLWERTHVITNGIDLERFNPRRQDRGAARESLGLKDRWALLLVGRLTEPKGHAVLLEALRRVREVLPPFQLLFAGDGPLKGTLERRAKESGLGGNVTFLGQRRDVPVLLAAADVVLMPSLTEGFPYALLEALAMGKPVVASRVNGVAEIMPTGEEGFLVPPRSPDKIVEALLTVLWNREDTTERAETGRLRTLREYDLRKSMARWQALYHQVSGDTLIQ